MCELQTEINMRVILRIFQEISGSDYMPAVGLYHA